MEIKSNTVVSLHYRLQKDNQDGELVEHNFDAQPLVFLFGAGQMIPGFEANLEGKKEGDTTSFSIPAKEAYGEVNQEAIVPLPKSTFIIHGELATDLLQVGKVIPMSDPPVPAYSPEVANASFKS